MQQPAPPDLTRRVAEVAASEPRGALRDIRLWITIGLVAVLALVWQVGFLMTGHPVSAEAANFLPLGIFLVPVLYAAITFGLGGGVAVAAVSAVATVPWVVQSLDQQDVIGAWFDVVQIVVLLVVAFFVGRGVRFERLARQAAERSRRDHLLAEMRYRDLFETNSQPILLADLSGSVKEANVAAVEAFGLEARMPARSSVADILGAEVWEQIRSGRPCSGAVEVAAHSGGRPSMLRPAGRMVAVEGVPMVQVVLQDVTEDARRRAEVQAYAADVVRGQEDERRRIAQDLHDGPLQTLVHVCRLIDEVSAEAAVPQSSDAGIRSSLANARAAVESAVAEVRQISRGLRPPLLDDLGLAAALDRLCDDVESRAGVAAVLRVGQAIGPMAPATELTVYRVAQEALSNVGRHAGASTVEMSLDERGGWVELDVVDDGDGFEVGSEGRAQDGWRFGLRGMAERAELSGGHLEVRSAPGEGTTVVLLVPKSFDGDAGRVRGAPADVVEVDGNDEGGAGRELLCGPAVAPDGDRGDDHQDAHRPGERLPYVAG
jgi:PAS domain S-box-containing protein